MIIELNKLTNKNTIKLFADEIYRNHLAYCGDKELAYLKSKEIITGIQEHGLEICTINKWPSVSIVQNQSISELSKKYSYINLEYVWRFFSSELKWILS